MSNKKDNQYNDIDIDEIKEAYSRDPPPPGFSAQEWNFVLEKSTELYNFMFRQLKSVDNPSQVLSRKAIMAVLSTATFSLLVTLTDHKTEEERKVFIKRYIAEMIGRLGTLDYQRFT